MSSRIRIDIKKGGTATVTKTSVVAAVHLLEQDPCVNISCTSQELTNWVYTHLHIKYEDGCFYAYLIHANNPQRGFLSSTVETTTKVEHTFKDVDEITLPFELSLLIRKSPLVQVVDKSIDDFI